MIRPARPADTPILKSLTAAAGVFKPHEIDVLQEVLDDYHAGRSGADHTAIVVDLEGRLAGYAYYAPDIMTDGSWYLYWIAVAKEIQGARLWWTAGCRTPRPTCAGARGGSCSSRHRRCRISELTRRFYLKHGYQITAQALRRLPQRWR